MTYRIIHRTTYKYKYPVSLGHHVACLTPRSLAHHRCTRSKLRITPVPTTSSERTDYFGNELKFFMIQAPHDQLVVEARSEVMIDEGLNPWPDQTPAWEEVVRFVPNDCTPSSLEAYQFVFESPRIRISSELAAYASRSFKPGRPFAQALLDLTARIHADFHFDSKATNVRTPTEEVFRKRRGVCQDFAHLQIACLRSLNLPARYVSGYLRTYTSPTAPRLIGANVSHAWVSAYCPGEGWLDVDPTNNVVPSTNHVTLAWGRDYGDVSPLRGLILGGRDHTLKVSVKVEPVNSY
jgi:transglutaminase-like putative cysteine protease